MKIKKAVRKQKSAVKNLGEEKLGQTNMRKSPRCTFYFTYLQDKVLPEFPVQIASGHSFNLDETIEQNGFNIPLVIKGGETKIDLCLPSRSHSLADIAKIIGVKHPVKVIEVGRQAQIGGFTIGSYADYIERSTYEHKILNMISLEVSNTPLNSQVLSPQFVRDIDWIDNVWPIDRRRIADYPQVQKYCLAGMAGSYTDFHVDFGGTSVWYHVLRGEKRFYLVPPTTENLLKYELWNKSPKQEEIFFGDLTPGQCFYYDLQPLETLMIPSGWIHAVYTPKDSLVFGGNFLHSYSILRQLQVNDIEARTQVGFAYRFPFFKQINWYFLCSLLPAALKFYGDVYEQKRLKIDDIDLGDDAYLASHCLALSSNVVLNQLPFLIKACELWISPTMLRSYDKVPFVEAAETAGFSTIQEIVDQWWELLPKIEYARIYPDGYRTRRSRHVSSVPLNRVLGNSSNSSGDSKKKVDSAVPSTKNSASRSKSDSKIDEIVNRRGRKRRKTSNDGVDNTTDTQIKWEEVCNSDEKILTSEDTSISSKPVQTVETTETVGLVVPDIEADDTISDSNELDSQDNDNLCGVDPHRQRNLDYFARVRAMKSFTEFYDPELIKIALGTFDDDMDIILGSNRNKSSSALKKLVFGDDMTVIVDGNPVKFMSEIVREKLGRSEEIGKSNGKKREKKKKTIVDSDEEDNSIETKDVAVEERPAVESHEKMDGFQESASSVDEEKAQEAEEIEQVTEASESYTNQISLQETTMEVEPTTIGSKESTIVIPSVVVIVDIKEDSSNGDTTVPMEKTHTSAESIHVVVNKESPSLENKREEDTIPADTRSSDSHRYSTRKHRIDPQFLEAAMDVSVDTPMTTVSTDNLGQHFSRTLPTVITDFSLKFGKDCINSNSNSNSNSNRSHVNNENGNNHITSTSIRSELAKALKDNSNPNNVITNSFLDEDDDDDSVFEEPENDKKKIVTDYSNSNHKESDDDVLSMDSVEDEDDNGWEDVEPVNDNIFLEETRNRRTHTNRVTNQSKNVKGTLQTISLRTDKHTPIPDNLRTISLPIGKKTITGKDKVMKKLGFKK